MSLLSGSGLAVWVLHLFLGQILQLVSGATLPVGFLICCLGVRKNIRFSCWVFNLLFGCQTDLSCILSVEGRSS